MPRPSTHELLRPRVTTAELCLLFDSYLRAGESLFAHPWRITAELARSASRDLGEGLLGAWGPGDVLAKVARAYGDWAIGMAWTLPVAAQALTASRPASGPGASSPYHHLPLDHAGPEAQGTMVGIGPGGAVPFVLPARIVDASQGCALWFVPIELASRVVAGGPSAAMLRHFDLVDCGQGRTAVALVAADYRVGDLGAYREIGLALSATPKGAAAQPGAFFLQLLVSGGFEVEATAQIWGLPKQPLPDLQVTYEPHRARFHTGHGGKGELAVGLPMLEGARSTDIPVLLYTLRDAGAPARTVIDRSGSGEGMQIGAAVELQLPERPAGPVALLCDPIRQLGLLQALPAFNSWTTRMFGEIGAPEMLQAQPFGNSRR